MSFLNANKLVDKMELDSNHQSNSFKHVLKNFTKRGRECNWSKRGINFITHYLGVIFCTDFDLPFNVYIHHISNKSMKILVFINCNIISFSNMYALNTIYASQERSMLEYASIVRSFHHMSSIGRLNKVKNEFLNLSTLHYGVNYLDLNFITDRLIAFSVTLNGVINTLNLFSKISLSLPHCY